MEADKDGLTQEQGGLVLKTKNKLTKQMGEKAKALYPCQAPLTAQKAACDFCL